mmetsp:Transcript_19145/g.53734  ORF Transcript_19145/g.53734 Transcript_19145/m.53734 type:complete len:250 (+) Transcript_19145:217-966(+)
MLQFIYIEEQRVVYKGEHREGGTGGRGLRSHLPLVNLTDNLLADLRLLQRLLLLGELLSLELELHLVLLHSFFVLLHFLALAGQLFVLPVDLVDLLIELLFLLGELLAVLAELNRLLLNLLLLLLHLLRPFFQLVFLLEYLALLLLQLVLRELQVLLLLIQVQLPLLDLRLERTDLFHLLRLHFVVVTHGLGVGQRKRHEEKQKEDAKDLPHQSRRRSAPATSGRSRPTSCHCRPRANLHSSAFPNPTS